MHSLNGDRGSAAVFFFFLVFRRFGKSRKMSRLSWYIERTAQQCSVHCSEERAVF